MSFREPSLSAEGWMLPALEEVSPTHFAHRYSHVTQMTEAPSARGRAPILSPPSSRQPTQHIRVSCRVELVSPSCFSHQPRAAAVTGFLHRQQRTYDIPVLPSPNHPFSAFPKPKGWKLSLRYTSPSEKCFLLS